MKKTMTLLIFSLTLTLMLSACGKGRGTRPFSDLKAGELACAELYLEPPGGRVAVVSGDRIAELAELLGDLVVYEQDDSGREYDGQLVQARITKTDGSYVEIGAYNPFLLIDGVFYKTEYAPCEALNAFGNSVYKAELDLHTAAAVAQIREQASLAEQDLFSFTADGQLESVEVQSQATVEKLIGCIQNSAAIQDVTNVSLKPMILPIRMGGRPAGDFESYFYTNSDTGQIVRFVFTQEDSRDFSGYIYGLAGILPESAAVSYSYGDAGMSLEIPEGWDYAIDEYEDGGYSFGVRFWPKTDPTGKIGLYYFTGGFGVCGTGLQTEPVAFESGLTGSMGTYDDHKVWDFISFESVPRGYAAMTEGNVAAWWPALGGEAMSILNSAKFGA